MVNEPNPYPFLALFVPGDRSDRFAKAAASGADAIVVDLEDAVPPAGKVQARAGLAEGLAAIAPAVSVYLRLNASDSPFFNDDVRAALTLPLAGVMLPKAEDPAVVAALAYTFGKTRRVIALVETPLGVAQARDIAVVSARLAFGSIDFAVSIGARHIREALAAARSEIVLASALAGRPGPIDGVTTAFDDPDAVEADADYAASLGFAGKLLIHPRQIEPALRGFAPSAAEIAKAERILAAAGEGAAVAVDGAMVDAPVIAWARGVEARAARLTERTR